MDIEKGRDSQGHRWPSVKGSLGSVLTAPVALHLPFNLRWVLLLEKLLFLPSPPPLTFLPPFLPLFLFLHLENMQAKRMS